MASAPFIFHYGGNCSDGGEDDDVIVVDSSAIQFLSGMWAAIPPVLLGNYEADDTMYMMEELHPQLFSEVTNDGD